LEKPDFLFKTQTLSYWKGKPYVGVGPSAHSFDGKNLRKWNINHNQKYITSISSGIIPCEAELLNENQLFNEKIMIGLRTEFGVDISQLEQQFSKITMEHFWKVYQQTKDKNQLIIENNNLKISIKKLVFCRWYRFGFFYSLEIHGFTPFTNSLSCLVLKIGWF
jgi:oxygen-independent coproporphyrinogen-3 oxidase